jgi:fumarate hydratase class II
MKNRIERDSMGEMEVPEHALWGASTQRAVLNFPVSALRFSERFISALGMIKVAAAHTNRVLGLLDSERADAIIRAGLEVVSGSLYPHFVVDVFQTGSGTSTNMNANEVIANRALEMLGKDRGERGFIHPNDHVNMCQSSNDVFPTAIHVSAYEGIKHALLPALEELRASLEGKAGEFNTVIKAGRTHLQDATPVTLGQEFAGYSAQIEHGMRRLELSASGLCRVALGGTAVGTGLNAHPEFATRAIAKLSELAGSPYTEAENHFEAQSSLDAALDVSGQLRNSAVALLKIVNDIRWLASGPRCGLGEISLPETQPGSSIMPAKVNPVICESTMMTCVHVIGSDTVVAHCGQHGNFELNTMMPVLAYNLLASIDLLANAIRNFSQRCVAGITANEAHCRELAEKSLATVTALAPAIGYDTAAQLAKRALQENRTVRQVAEEMNVLPKEELARLLDLVAMTKPGL